MSNNNNFVILMLKLTLILLNSFFKKYYQPIGSLRHRSLRCDHTKTTQMSQSLSYQDQSPLSKKNKKKLSCSSDMGLKKIFVSHKTEIKKNTHTTN